MHLRDRLAAHQHAFETVMAIAVVEETLMFADLCWPPFDVERVDQCRIERRPECLLFKTRERIVALHEQEDGIRYYAGGWCLSESQIVVEQHRMHAEGGEIGVFSTPLAAICFAEEFLSQGLPVQEIEVPRTVHYHRETDNGFISSLEA